MQEHESQNFVKEIATGFVGREPSEVSLLSSGHGPDGWSQNRVWKVDFLSPNSGALVVKVGDGPMAELVLREIDLMEKVLPLHHHSLPIIHQTGRKPTPYMVMEHLAVEKGVLDLAETPTSVLWELAEILPALLLGHRGEGYRNALAGQTNIPGIPSSLSYGCLNLRNIGRRMDGKLVIFDWDGARRAPLGYDFKLFQRHAAFPEAMALFYVQCLRHGVTLPPVDTWRQTLAELWRKEDERFGAA